MANHWPSEFGDRMPADQTNFGQASGDVPVSIKARVASGCFHREHSPAAYALIDQHLKGIPVEDRRFAFEEHESGPEILVYVAVTTAGITLAKSVLDLVTAIIKARSEGRPDGDHPSVPQLGAGRDPGGVGLRG